MLKDQHLLAESEDLPVAIIAQHTKTERGWQREQDQK